MSKVILLSLLFLLSAASQVYGMDKERDVFVKKPSYREVAQLLQDCADLLLKLEKDPKDNAYTNNLMTLTLGVGTILISLSCCNEALNQGVVLKRNGENL